jgi:hypothetical protein
MANVVAEPFYPDSGAFVTRVGDLAGENGCQPRLTVTRYSRLPFAQQKRVADYTYAAEAIAAPATTGLSTPILLNLGRTMLRMLKPKRQVDLSSQRPTLAL